MILGLLFWLGMSGDWTDLLATQSEANGQITQVQARLIQPDLLELEILIFEPDRPNEKLTDRRLIACNAIRAWDWLSLDPRQGLHLKIVVTRGKDSPTQFDGLPGLDQVFTILVGPYPKDRVTAIEQSFAQFAQCQP
ncbi:MAG: hypothetical protein H6510_07100 [Acidobacteria bacterium]|nr:hypothetical protein [Acidobacteriota bacterium]MCB9397562.1 hypothetical protein [Acidobacteriota bacterium]